MAVRKWVGRNYVQVPQDHVIRYSWSYDTGELVWHSQGYPEVTSWQYYTENLRLKTHDKYIVCGSVLY
jgi:hypothetical protein